MLIVSFSSSRIRWLNCALTADLTFKTGFNNSKDPVNPPLDGTPHMPLIDFLVARRIFTFYLNNAWSAFLPVEVVDCCLILV